MICKMRCTWCYVCLCVLLAACSGVDTGTPAAAPMVVGHGVVVARGGSVLVPAPQNGVVADVAVHVGETVRAGDPIARLESAEDATRAAIAATVAAQAAVELTLARHRASAARREAEELRTAVADDAAAGIDLRRALANLAELEAQAEIAAISQRRAALERRAAAERLDRDLVRAPVSGVVSAVTVRAGARTADDAIATIEPSSGRDALVRFSEDYLGCVRPGDELEVAGDAGARSPVTGVVASMSPIVSDAVAPDGVAERGFDALVRLPSTAFALGQHVIATLRPVRPGCVAR